MMEMIERVARAIAGCQQELGVDKWRYCLPEARAAIEAMREPTDAMIDAGVDADYGGTLGSRAVNCFIAMINAALLEQQP